MARWLALLWFAGACTRVNPAFGLDDTAGDASASGSGPSGALEGGPSTSLESTVGGASESGQNDSTSASSGDSNATTAPLETSSETGSSGCRSPDSSELGWRSRFPGPIMKSRSLNSSTRVHRIAVLVGLAVPHEHRQDEAVGGRKLDVDRTGEHHVPRCPCRDQSSREAAGTCDPARTPPGRRRVFHVQSDVAQHQRSRRVLSSR